MILLVSALDPILTLAVFMFLSRIAVADVHLSGWLLATADKDSRHLWPGSRSWHLPGLDLRSPWLAISSCSCMFVRLRDRPEIAHNSLPIHIQPFCSIHFSTTIRTIHPILGILRAFVSFEHTLDAMKAVWDRWTHVCHMSPFVK